MTGVQTCALPIFAVGWELALVGVGFAPVFIVATRYSSRTQSRLESDNKALRETVSTKFHQVRHVDRAPFKHY